MENQQKGHCKHGEFILTEGCPECIAERQERDNLANKVEGGFYDLQKEETEGAMLRIAEIDQEAPPVSIVKVRYLTVKVDVNTRVETPEFSGREYTHFSEEPLALGDIVQVPVRDTVTKAKVTTVNVPEAEIAAFRDKVKTIPTGSIMVRSAPDIYQEEGSEGLAFAIKAAEEGAESPWVRPASEAEPFQDEFTGVPFGEGVVATSSEDPAKPPEPDYGPTEGKPAALVTIERQVGKPTVDLLPLYQEAASLLQFARKRVIATNDDLKPATDDLAIIAKCKKAMVKRKDEIVGPFKARLDEINQAFADLMFPVFEADRLTRGKVTEYDNKVRAQTAEAKRLEDEKFKLAQEEAAFSGTGEHTQELGTAVAPPPVPEHTRTNLGMLGGRDNWKARVVDFAALPDEYKLPNEPLLNSFARSTKGTRPMPGVEFYNDRVVTMRPK